MNVGINLYSKWPYEKIIKAFILNGINRTFVCTDHPQFVDVMKSLKNNNITVDNFHAPFKGLNRIWSEDKDGAEALKSYLDSVDICVKYDVPVLVVHVSNGRPMPPISKRGIERFAKFMSYADSRGVIVAVENHRYVENVKYIMEKFPGVSFCWDTSHAHGFTPGISYMPMWGDRLVATHISDNDSVCDKDMHMLPFDGIIDFNSVANDLVKYRYNGTLMLEVKPDNHILYAGMTVEEYYARAAESVNTLKTIIKNFKNMEVVK